MNADNGPLNLWEKTRPWPQRLLMEAINGAIPASAIQQVLEKTQATGQRDRYLTGRVTVLMVPAICLWPTVCMRDCLRNLIEGCCQGLGRILQQIPVKSAITAARNRLGVRPLRELFRLVVHPLATNATQGAFYKGLRLVSFDGSILNVPDTPANERAFGRPGSSRGRAAFPQLRLVWFMEVATRAALDFIAVPSRRAEATVIPRLFRSLKEGLLVLWDRGFHIYKLYTSVMHIGAHLLPAFKRVLSSIRSSASPTGRSWPSSTPVQATAGKIGGALSCASLSTRSMTPTVPDIAKNTARLQRCLMPIFIRPWS